MGKVWDCYSGMREDWEAGPAAVAPAEAGRTLGASPPAVSRGVGLSRPAFTVSLVN